MASTVVNQRHIMKLIIWTGNCCLNWIVSIM